MLFKTAFALLIVWLLGMFGVYRVGNLAHVLLLVGLMLLLLAVLKAREAALGSELMSRWGQYRCRSTTREGDRSFDRRLAANPAPASACCT